MATQTRRAIGTVSDGGYVAVGGGTAFGSGLQPNSDLSGTAGGHDGTGSGSGAVADDYTIFSIVGDVYTSSKDGNDHQVITATIGDNVLIRATANKPTLSSGTLYKASITLSELTGSVDWLVGQSSSANVQFQNTITSAGTYTQYFIAGASFSASVYLQLLDAGESCTISEMSIKAVTESIEMWFDSGTTIDLVGIASDVEDGDLTGASLVWTSSLDGALGTGQSLSDVSLTDGSHVIALTATDSAAATGTDTIIVRVAVDITLRPQTRQGQRTRLAWR